MQTLAAAFLNQWARIVRDPGVLLICVLGVLGYSFMYPLPYRNQLVREVPVAVVDLDHSGMSRQWVRMAGAHEGVRIVSGISSLGEAERALREGRVGGYVLIPQGFARDVYRGTASVAVGGDAAMFIVANRVLNALSETGAFFSAGIRVRKLQAAGLSREQAMAAVQPAPLVIRPVGNTREGYGAYIVPAVFVLILHQTLLLGIGLSTATRRDPVFRDRLPSGETGNAEPASAFGPFRRLAAVLGTNLAFVSLYMVSALFYWGLAFVWYDLPGRVHVVPTLLFCVPFLLATASLGQLLGGFMREREIIIPVVVMISIPLLFVSGVAWPRESLPAFLQHLSLIAPSTHAIPGLVQINQLQARWQDVVPAWVSLWILAAVFMGIQVCVGALARKSSSRAV